MIGMDLGYLSLNLWTASGLASPGIIFPNLKNLKIKNNYYPNLTRYFWWAGLSDWDMSRHAALKHRLTEDMVRGDVLHFFVLSAWMRGISAEEET